ncbi:hypothetical protein FNV43_RR11221 [Rhamnella rubrinervis]|uniref:lactoylglutathione lyase n=1 Tax=Rhamnella rubrinervis TaxID=2594499 RepID=A0A8K0H5K7_9ROSA|nr:hypothetical protein FNV43_RR11221 [Rhamnella rubrinervis]
MASLSATLNLSTFRASLPQSSPSLRRSSVRSSSSSYSPSRRLALFHLGSALPQSQLFGVKAPTFLRADGKIIEASQDGNVAQASTTTTKENVLEFYTECLGMKLLRKRDIPEERYTNAFLGYGPEDSHFVVELTYNYGVNRYDIGTVLAILALQLRTKLGNHLTRLCYRYGKIIIFLSKLVTKAVELIKAKGGKVTREPGPIKGGSTIIAFIEDPDGYKFELLERGPTPEPLCQVMLRVGDLDRAIKFYKKAFGMELLRRSDNPDNKYTVAIMGYGPEEKNAVLELTYNYGVTDYDKGNGYAQIAIGTDDVYKTAEAIRLSGGTITREPGPLPGINTKITACLDPDGWKSVFVDNVDLLKELE